MATLSRIPLPTLDVGAPPPSSGADEHLARIAAAQERFAAHGIDCLVVFADRESFADLHYLTGADPRFEEALYVLPAEGAGTMLLGNENLHTWPVRDLGIDVVLYQALSPAGQRRDAPVLLDEVLRRAGIAAGMRIGVAGGKRIDAGYVEDPLHAIAAPAYIVDTLRTIVGATGELSNCEAMFTAPHDGLRSVLSPQEIALFEYGSSLVSSAVVRAMGELRPGLSESTLANLLRDDGLPHSCHTMVSFGPGQGLYSPSSYEARLGDAFTIAFGLRGGLTCRAGAIAHSDRDLEPDARRVFGDLAWSYFDTVVAWHEAVRVDTTAGAVVDAVDRTPKSFELFLNPGHLLHLEEWMHTPFVQGDDTPLRSGMRLQCDIIPVTPVANTYVNIEDGVVLADAVLRAELATRFPEMWERIEARRDFTREVIGVNLHESVLPVSNGLLWHTPYALERDLAFVKS